MKLLEFLEVDTFPYTLAGTEVVVRLRRPSMRGRRALREKHAEMAAEARRLVEEAQSPDPAAQARASFAIERLTEISDLMQAGTLRETIARVENLTDWEQEYDSAAEAVIDLRGAELVAALRNGAEVPPPLPES